MNDTIRSLYIKLQRVLNIPYVRYGIFFIATFTSIILMGYHFSTFDQAIHIPFLKKYSDPTLYPHDGFFDLRFIHYSFFWILFIPFHRAHILEISMFIIYFGIIYLTFIALWRISNTLFRNNIVSFITTICFIFPHIGFAGFPLIEFSLLNRTFVLPFLLLSIELYLRKKYLWTFIMLGVMYNLHVVTVNFVLAMMAIDILMRIKTIGIKNCFGMSMAFITTSLPVLIWKFSGGGVDLRVNKEWLDIISIGMLNHLFNLFSSNINIFALTVLGISCIVLYYFTTRNLKLNEKDEIIRNFILGILLVLSIVFFTSNLSLYPATILIQSQIIRIGIFALLFGYLYGINYMVLLYEKKQIHSAHFILLFISVITSIFPIMFLCTLIFHKLLSKKSALIIGVMLVIVFVGLAPLAYGLNLWRPGIHIFAVKDEQTDIQLWLKNNTPKDALIITPPYTWWFYNVEWRVLSERANLVSLSDLLEVAFSPQHVAWWKPRFEAVAPGVISKFTGDVFESIRLTRKSYLKLTSSDFIRIGTQFNAKYVVVESFQKLQLPLVYKNNKFAVYHINQL